METRDKILDIKAWYEGVARQIPNNIRTNKRLDFSAIEVLEKDTSFTVRAALSISFINKSDNAKIYYEKTLEQCHTGGHIAKNGWTLSCSQNSSWPYVARVKTSWDCAAFLDGELEEKRLALRERFKEIKEAEAWWEKLKNIDLIDLGNKKNSAQERLEHAIRLTKKANAPAFDDDFRKFSVKLFESLGLRPNPSAIAI